MRAVVDDDALGGVPSGRAFSVVHMTRKSNPIDAAHARKLYESGQTLSQIARAFRIRSTQVRALVVAAGGTIRPVGGGVGYGMKPVDTAEIVARYESGESARSIGRDLGCAQGTVYKRLTEAGVPIRSVAETMDRAHAAVRGINRTESELIERARAIEAAPGNVSRYEIDLRTMLADRGIVTIPQRAVHVYNVDLAAEPVAVEVFGGNWHFGKDHRQRFRDLADRGWLPLVVWIDPHPKHCGLHVGAADQVVALVESARLNPPARGQYWMVRGTGDLVAAGNVYDDAFALVRPTEDMIARASDHR